MGLDITAYRNLTKLDVVFDADGEPVDPQTRESLDYDSYDLRCYFNPDYASRAEGLEDKAVYKAEDSIGFRAGSYGGYNAWREELARLAGYPAVQVDRYNTGSIQLRHDYGAWAATEGPFWELIHFSDCEGVIGPVVAAKLAKEFAEWDERAKAHSNTVDRGDWFYPLYQEWRQAFEMAAQNGAVDFH
ncbi:hypothetical protein G3N95_29870 [Paraburkholderia sp. Tr-20389]|uniref:hypothetical protein n=1 Tax=Paraburkholderia sp. Tr-20389 TaxID=2703903 RepID=UPI00197EF0A2|nr:hypothetical protein [Paraburkholderia sp. Tr-20389]MBN3757183.1 hypothetical protein [Paraburkholderia sp. Tr-20389]